MPIPIADAASEFWPVLSRCITRHRFRAADRSCIELTGPAPRGSFTVRCNFVEENHEIVQLPMLPSWVIPAGVSFLWLYLILYDLITSSFHPQRPVRTSRRAKCA